MNKFSYFLHFCVALTDFLGSADLIFFLFAAAVRAGGRWQGASTIISRERGGGLGTSQYVIKDGKDKIKFNMKFILYFYLFMIA